MNPKRQSALMINAIAVGLVIFSAFGCTDSSITVGSSVEISPAGSGNSPPVPQYYADETVQFEIAAQDRTRLSINSINGEISVESREDVQSIVVSAQKRVGSFSRADARIHIEDLKIDITGDDDDIVITSRHEDSSEHVSLEINYSILLPVDMDIDVLHLNGDIFLTDLQADVRVALTNGFIDATLPVQDDAAVHMTVVNGGIDVKLPREASASIDASVTTGTIEIMNLVLNVSVQTANAVTGTVGDGRGAIDLHVVNGPIIIEGLDPF